MVVAVGVGVGVVGLWWPWLGRTSQMILSSWLQRSIAAGSALSDTSDAAMSSAQEPIDDDHHCSASPIGLPWASVMCTCAGPAWRGEGGGGEGVSDVCDVCDVCDLSESKWG